MMYKKYIYFLLLLLIASFYRCTEVYYPDISTETEALVVEGLITNETGPFTIKLSMAKPLRFDSTGLNAYAVRGARVIITENDKIKYYLSEEKPGLYLTPDNFKTNTGSFYKLNIKTSNGDSYVSNSEMLLTPQGTDTIRAFVETQNYVNNESEVVNVTGANVKVDLFSGFSKTNNVPSCRFSPVLTYQFLWTYRDRDINGNEIMSYHWINFGWKNYVMNSFENITDEKESSANPQIKNHQVCFIPFEAKAYSLLFADPKVIFYVRMKQFTLNHDSYRFYQSAKNQLSATGKLFDPINSQLYGNMRCENDKSKVVLGLFEVSSVTNHAFVVEVGSWMKSTRIKYVDYVDIPENNDFTYRKWDLMGPTPNDPTYNPIPQPEWWNHNIY